jgi:hypothetical protein
MEFVIIEYPSSRRVRMDSATFGRTNTVLRCRAGLHTFDLATPHDYTPLRQTTRVTGTDPQSPMRVVFQPIEASLVTIIVPAAPADAEAPSRTPKRAGRKKAAKKKVSRKKSTGKKKKAKVRRKHR